MARTVLERMDVLEALLDVFSEFSYDAASYGTIESEKGIAKSSLYHFFRRGKEDMAVAALNHWSDVFHSQVIEPLQHAQSVEAGVVSMTEGLAHICRRGRRSGPALQFSTDQTRHLLQEDLRHHFMDWALALARLLGRNGYARGRAWSVAEDTLAAVLGALVLARGMDDDKVFVRMLRRLRRRFGNTVR